MVGKVEGWPERKESVVQEIKSQPHLRGTALLRKS